MLNPIRAAAVLLSLALLAFPAAAKPPPVRPLGKAASAAQRKAYINNASRYLTQNASTIVSFINSNGCVMKGKKRVPMAEGTLKQLASATAARTDLFWLSKSEVARLTGRQDAVAFGITAELKKRLVTERQSSLGLPGRNAIALIGPPADEDLKNDPGHTRVAHELLHIVLRQVQNEDLGGGKRKTDDDPAIANLHHRLTDYLGWTQAAQASQPWSPSPASCK